MLTIGIPSKGTSASLIRVIEIALTCKDAVEILVSINPGSKDVEISPSILADHRIKITSQTTDIGLYGNFRFLAKNASQPYFMWLCTDDTPTSSTNLLLEIADSQKANLVIPSWEYSEYSPETTSHFGRRIKGPSPNLECRKFIVESVISPEPSWIFGMWKRTYLVSIFPKRDFDWLDCHLLQKVILSGKVELVSVPDPTTIGTWTWAGKLPNSVSPTGHSPFKAYIYQLGVAPKILALWPPSVRYIYKRFVNLHKQSQNLNARMKS